MSIDWQINIKDNTHMTRNMVKYSVHIKKSEVLVLDDFKQIIEAAVFL
jgi:hypothetical protein